MNPVKLQQALWKSENYTDGTICLSSGNRSGAEKTLLRQMLRATEVFANRHTWQCYVGSPVFTRYLYTNRAGIFRVPRLDSE